jgi:glycosyltransferase involved in cell wall biosynthesis
MRPDLQGKLKVLQIVDVLSMGGAETWLMELLRWWHRQGSDAPQMDFLVTSGKPGIFDDEARALGAKIFYLRYGRSSLASFARGFKQILRRGAYSAIHDHQGYASGLHFLLGAEGLPAVRVVHVHNAMYQVGNLRLDRRLAARIGKGLIARHSTHIAGTSRQLITEYGFDTPGFGRIPRAALYCGFDPARFLGDVGAAKVSVCREFGWPADAKIILFAGRIDPSPDIGHPENCKNSGFAVSVGIECARRDARIHMILAGEPSSAVPILEQRIAAAGLAGRIRFAGIRTDIERLLIAGDVLLFPSRAEGLGMVAVEAQAAGLPVLASAAVPRECVVVPELVRFQGLEDGEAKWAAHLLELAARPRNVLDANRRVAASAFAIDNSARALVSLYSNGSLPVRARTSPLKESRTTMLLPAASGARLPNGDLKVLQVVDTLSMGGAETWLMELLRWWHRQGPGAPQIDFLATSGKPGIFDAEARALGAKIFYLPYGRTNLASFTRGLKQILRRGAYSAIHDHQDYASGWHFLMGANALPPVRVTHVHNPAYQIRNNYGVTLSRRLAAGVGKRLVARYSTHITGTSRQVIAEYDFDAPPYCRIPKAALYCGFDPARFLGDAAAAKASVCREFDWPQDSTIILVAGRIDESADLGHPQNHKNSGFAVSVGIECARRDARVRMLLAGAPRKSAVTILEQRIAAAGLSGRIRFIGIRKDIERLMIASDVLLFPSRGEGLGMVAVEAQAAGLPVLASTAVPRECVVVPELVRFQTLEAGAAAWAADLLEHAAQPRNIVGANRRVAASKFAIDHSARALFELYRDGSLA